MALYMLMNKNREVLEFEYDLALHQATRIVRVVDAAYAPSALRTGMGK